MELFLKKLTVNLFDKYGEKVFVLIDEIDAAYIHLLFKK